MFVFTLDPTLSQIATVCNDTERNDSCRNDTLSQIAEYMVFFSPPATRCHDTLSQNAVKCCTTPGLSFSRTGQKALQRFW